MRRDHDATSYSTETKILVSKPLIENRRDHNATSYSTETAWLTIFKELLWRRDHNATSYSTETLLKLFPFQALAAQRS